MDKSIAGLIGAVSVLAAGSAQAAAAAPVQLDQVMRATSYADLLRPVPNALAVLRAQSELPAPAPTDDATAMLRKVQYHHHHHHHHRRHHHHHHHHHHSDYDL